MKVNLFNSGGIYVILNILDWKAYVGQAKNFNNRDHMYELEKGYDNTELQVDYDKDKEFVYMILYYDPNKTPSKKELDKYEQMYMTLMEHFGFVLYNTQCNRSEKDKEKRRITSLKIEDELYIEAEKTFIDDFVKHFGVNPTALIDNHLDKRKNALDYYAKKRLNPKENDSFTMERFLFNRDRIQTLLGNKTKSIYALNIEEMIISKAGTYLEEGLDQILNYELSAIHNRKYCLWTFAYQALSYDTVIKYLKDRQRKNKDTYIIFEYTPSNVYASSEPMKFDCLKKKDAKKILEKELDFLSFEQGKDGNYYVPLEINCTATSAPSTRAFVIQDLFLLDEVIDSEKLKKYYQAVRAGGLGDISEGGYQRSTHYIKDNGKDFELTDILDTKKQRKFCFAGKLAAPYIVPLHTSEQA